MPPTPPARLDERFHRTPDGAEIAYRLRPGREPWVLLHGLGCDAGMWDAVVEEMPTDVGLLIPDLRGHGGSTLGWRPPSIDLLAEDVLALVEREGLARPRGAAAAASSEGPAVAGLSMGGYTALALAEARPGLARAYAFVSTQAGADDEAARGRRAEGLALLRRRGWRALLDGLMPALLAEGRPDFPRHRERMLLMFERAGDAGLAAALFALANRPDRRTVLPRLGAPAVAVVGDADRLTPPDRAREIVRGTTDARLVILPGVAHMSALEAPREVAAALASLPGQGARPGPGGAGMIRPIPEGPAR
jgi:pimeloyl-ACP methyl ester carboxylesterase